MKAKYYLWALASTLLLFACTCDTSSPKPDNDVVINDDKADSNQNNTSNNKTFRSTDEGFEISFPRDYVGSSESVDTDLGKLDMHMLSSEISSEYVFMCTYTDYPVSMTDETVKESVLSGAKDGALHSIPDLRLISENKVDISGHPGYKFHAKNDDFDVHYTLYLINNKLVQLAVFSQGKDAVQSEVDDFFNSFKLI